MVSKIHVAVGVIRDRNGQYLISKRSENLHQGGLWEFPGGKVETNETNYQALCRELHEELDINVLHAEPLIKITHSYPDKQVLLDVWLIDSFNGSVVSLQQQPIKWVSNNELSNYSFPEANKAILTCLTLPSYYAITGSSETKDDYLNHLTKCLDSNIKLVQLRCKKSTKEQLLDIAKASTRLCKQYGAKLIVNSSIDILGECDADGIHLNSERLMSYESRPISADKLLVASVHNQNELSRAIDLNVDFVVVSPVLETKSHPDATILDWNGLDALVSQSNIPIFALGGMKKSLLKKAKQYGAVGIAGISEFWC